MQHYHVEDMTCGHCASTITKAVQGVDPQARVEIDIAAKSVKVEADASAEAIQAAIADAGYTPVAC